MFCLQCGQTLHNDAPVDDDNLSLEETTDPMLQRAIRDAGNYSTQFKPPPVVDTVIPVVVTPAPKPKRVSGRRAGQPVRLVPARRRRSFVSLHALVMAPRALTPENMLWAGAAVAKAPAGLRQATEVVAERTEHKPAEVQTKAAVRRHTAVRGWLAAMALVMAAVGLNFWASSFYTDRLYPGAKIGTVNVGGWTFADLEASLPALLVAPELSANVDGRLYPLEMTATANREPVERELKELGRQTPLPALGVIHALVSAPVEPKYTLSDDAVDRATAQLAAKVDRSASDAFITTIDTGVFIIAEKTGNRLDKTAASAAIRSAYGVAPTVRLKTEKVAAKIAAADYAADKAAAEALIAQPVQVTVRRVEYKATPAQVAGWLVFNGPGKGVSVDPAGVAEFIRGIPGRFDRAQAATAVTAALNERKSAQLTASTRRITAAPRPVSTAAAWPLMNYNYCIQSGTGNNNALAEALTATLTMKDGWSLGGRVKYTAVQTGCNFAVNLTDSEGLKQLDSVCETYTTCRIHNELAINLKAWSNLPAAWTTDQEAYRHELIGQGVGHWLGFDHASCRTGQTAAAPVAQPTINVAGCSPVWYPVPPELQDSKILDGFEA